MLVIIYFIDYKIGLGITLISTISLYLFKVQLKKSKDYLEEEFINTDKYTTVLNETSKGIKEIKELDIKEKCINIFSSYINSLSEVRKKRRLLNKTVNTAKWTIRIIGDTIILLYIISKVQAGMFSVETAMLIITYMTNIVDDVFHRIIEHDFGISEFTANMKRIKEIYTKTHFFVLGPDVYAFRLRIHQSPICKSLPGIREQCQKLKEQREILDKYEKMSAQGKTYVSNNIFYRL